MLVFRIRFDAEEEGKHEVQISIIDADGKALLPPNKKEIMTKMQNAYSTCTNLGMVGLNGMVLPTFGDYNLNFFVDGKLLGSQPPYFEKISAK